MNQLQQKILRIFYALMNGYTLSTNQVVHFVNAYGKQYTVNEVYEAIKSLGKYLEKVGDKRKTLTAQYRIKKLNNLKDYY